jgi:spermidine synthase
VVVVLALLLAGAAALAQTRTLYDKQSEFNRIIVQEDSRGVRTLQFAADGATQTAVDTQRPTRLMSSYTRTAMLGLALVPQPKRILMVGLGGGAMPMFLRRNFPDAVIDVAELDPAVADVARQFFLFKEDDKMKVHVGDGRKFIENVDARYDVIFLDAYGADYIPYSLATREFLQAVRRKLSDDGVVVANVWGFGSNKLYYSMVRTYMDVFEEMHIVRAPASDNHMFFVLPRKLGLTSGQLRTKALAEAKSLKPQLPLASMIDSGYEPLRELPESAKVLVDADAPKP